MGTNGRLKEKGNQMKSHDRVWSIVLAGGEGQRLRPFVQRWLGQVSCGLPLGFPRFALQTLQTVAFQTFSLITQSTGTYETAPFTA